MAKRKAISNRVRFEVFKRDSFTCQYCGGKAPDVLLHIDHIKPISKGGSNSLLNLITACQGCNSGKSDKPLDDGSVVAKKRQQLEGLQERKEQIEMMVEWETGLGDEIDMMVEGIETIFNKIAQDEGRGFTGDYKARLKKLLKKYSFQEVSKAIKDATETYLRFDGDDAATDDSQNKALGKVESILRINRRDSKLPGYKKIGLLYSIAKRRFERVPEYWVFEALLVEALESGANIQEIDEHLRKASYWSIFKMDIEEYVAHVCGVNHG